MIGDWRIKLVTIRARRFAENYSVGKVSRLKPEGAIVGVISEVPKYLSRKSVLQFVYNKDFKEKFVFDVLHR